MALYEVKAVVFILIHANSEKQAEAKAVDLIEASHDDGTSIDSTEATMLDEEETTEE